MSKTGIYKEGKIGDNIMNDEPVNEKVCDERHKRVDQRMLWVESDIKGIKNQITATLIFSICTLITIIILLLRGI